MGIYNTAKEAIKDAVSLAQQSDNIQLYKSVLDAYNAAIELMSENADLREEIKKLKKEIELKETVHKRGDAYYKMNDDGNEEGPYCMNCWDSNHKLIHYRHLSGERYYCHTCKFDTYNIINKK